MTINDSDNINDNDDSILEESNKQNKTLSTEFTIINTNARSLCPKIHSLLDCFTELKADLAIITETWLTDGPTLQEDIDDLREGSGLGLLVRNREPGARGHSHGGVGIAFRISSCTFKELQINNPDRYEVIAALGTIPGHSRKLLVIGCYLPPGDNAARGNGCLGFIEDLVVCLLYTSPSPRDLSTSRMPSSA